LGFVWVERIFAKSTLFDIICEQEKIMSGKKTTETLRTQRNMFLKNFSNLCELCISVVILLGKTFPHFDDDLKNKSKMKKNTAK
jgi:hypothetical protein